MGFEDLRIRDISRATGEWAPPVGALGGPPAHELYRDLVAYAGLQLFQDARGHPWVVFRDGAQRRSFSVPSLELRGALDRFRMRRSARPLPRADLDEFVRIVEARISDPDVNIPVLRSPVAEGESAPGPGSPGPSPPHGSPPTKPVGASTPPRAPSGSSPDEAALPGPHDGSMVAEVIEARSPNLEAAVAVVPDLNTSISGGRHLSYRDNANVARYVRILRRLVRDGDWMGTTRELSEETRDDPLTLYGALIRYRAELEDHGILFASVDLAEGFRWLVVDRAKFRTPAEARVLRDQARATLDRPTRPGVPPGPGSPVTGPKPTGKPGEPPSLPPIPAT